MRLESQHQLHEAARRARSQRERGELAARHQTLARRHHSARAKKPPFSCAATRTRTAHAEERRGEERRGEKRKSPIERHGRNEAPDDIRRYSKSNDPEANSTPIKYQRRILLEIRRKSPQLNVL